MKHASLKDTIHISMGEFSGMLRHCKTLAIIPIDGSANVDAVVVAGEMLNMPHVERQ